MYISFDKYFIQDFFPLKNHSSRWKFSHISTLNRNLIASYILPRSITTVDKECACIWWEGTRNSQAVKCLGVGVVYSWGSSSPSHRIPNNRRTSVQTPTWPPSIWKGFTWCVLCTTGWSHHSTEWANPTLENSQWHTVDPPMPASPELFFSYLTCCISLLSRPPLFLSTLSTAPDRKGQWKLDSNFPTFF